MKMLVRILDRSLAKCGLYRLHRYFDLRRRAVNNARANGKRVGIQKGLKAGHKSGTEEGYKNGYSSGFQEGQYVYKIEDTRTLPEIAETTGSIYGPSRWNVSESMRNEFDSQVDLIATTEGTKLSKPTKAQWQMIFADHPATCVVAAAGSGKSTTLVLRVLFMHKFLNIALDKITVVSFTKDACTDLREKMRHVFGLWDQELDDRTLKKLIRTFHSVLYQQGRSAFPRSAMV